MTEEVFQIEQELDPAVLVETAPLFDDGLSVHARYLYTVMQVLRSAQQQISPERLATDTWIPLGDVLSVLGELADAGYIKMRKGDGQ